MAAKSWKWQLLSLWGLSTIAAGWGTSAAAAEQVVLRYSVLERSVPVSELSTFAETGEASRRLRRYMRQAGQDPQKVREVMTKEIEVTPVTLDRVFNHFLGETLLDQASGAIHTESGGSDREALRSALVLAASDDSKVSLIEVIEEYPTREVYVEGDRLVETYNQIQAVSGGITSAGENLNLEEIFEGLF